MPNTAVRRRALLALGAAAGLAALLPRLLGIWWSHVLPALHAVLVRGKAGQSCQCCGAQLGVLVARRAWLVCGPTQQCSCAVPSHRSTKRGRSLIGNKQLVHRSHGRRQATSNPYP